MLPSRAVLSCSDINPAHALNNAGQEAVGRVARAAEEGGALPAHLIDLNVLFAHRIFCPQCQPTPWANCNSSVSAVARSPRGSTLPGGVRADGLLWRVIVQIFTRWVNQKLNARCDAPPTTTGLTITPKQLTLKPDLERHSR
jgi:hypothetical protein